LEFSIVNNNEKAVLLLHGLTGTPLELRWVARDFSKENYDVYFPILPGHCSSLEEIKNIKAFVLLERIRPLWYKKRIYEKKNKADDGKRRKFWSL
jgi:esterase/lipase